MFTTLSAESKGQPLSNIDSQKSLLQELCPWGRETRDYLEQSDYWTIRKA